MYKIAFTETFEDRRHIPDMVGGRAPADQKVTVFQSRHKVAVVRSTLVVGVPRGHPDKRYYNWRTTASFGFRRNTAGNIVPFQCTRNWDSGKGSAWHHITPTAPFNMLEKARDDQPDDLGRAFQHACWEEFNITDIKQIYPMLDKYNMSRYSLMPTNLRPAFRQDNWEAYAAVAFGKTRRSKRLVAAVQNAEPFIVSYAQQFRGLVSDEQMVSYMENNFFDDEMEANFKPFNINFRPLLLAASPQVREHFIKERLTAQVMDRLRSKSLYSKNELARMGRDYYVAKGI